MEFFDSLSFKALIIWRLLVYAMVRVTGHGSDLYSKRFFFFFFFFVLCVVRSLFLWFIHSYGFLVLFAYGFSSCLACCYGLKNWGFVFGCKTIGLWILCVFGILIWVLGFQVNDFKIGSFILGVSI